MKRWPLQYVEDGEVWNFSKFDIALLSKAVVEVIFKRIEIFEKKITHHLKGTKGALMYDGWTHNYTHFVGLFYPTKKKHQLVSANI